MKAGVLFAMRLSKRCVVMFLLAFAAAVPAFAADLVSVSTHVSYPTASPGGANEGSVLIANDTSADVRVRLDMRVVFSDGSVQRLTRIPDPGVLPPGGGFIQSVFFVIPADAPPGPATFVAEVVANARGLQEHETSGAAFEVVSP